MFVLVNCVFIGWLIYKGKKRYCLEGAGILYQKSAFHTKIETMVALIKIVTDREGIILFKQQEQEGESAGQQQLSNDEQREQEEGHQFEQ